MMSNVKCWSCGTEFTPRFQLIPDYPLYCDSCVARSVVKGVKDMVNGKLRAVEDFRNMPEPPPRTAQQEPLAPMIEAAS